jgi:DNA-binding NarL/FixJ family response regulator
MSENLTSLRVDADGVETIRDLTSAEIAERKAITNFYLEQELAKQAKIAARESALAKLAALGLTEAEIAAL